MPIFPHYKKGILQREHNDKRQPTREELERKPEEKNIKSRITRHNGIFKTA